MGFLQTFSPIECIVNAIKHLWKYLRNSFCQSYSNSFREKFFFSFEQFEKWLYTTVKEQFNHIANILSNDVPDIILYQIILI